MTLTLIVGLLTLNLLAANHFVRIDLTQHKVYTLSEATKNILKGLDDIISIRLYFSSDLPPALIALKTDVADLLGEFKTYSQGNVRVEFHDPQSDPIQEQKVQMMGIPPVEVGVIKKDKQELTKVYLGLSIHFGPKQEIIPVIQSAQSLEYQLASGILKVTQVKNPTLGWWGKESETSDYQLISDYLKKRFTIEWIDETTLDRLDVKKIPVLVMIAPAGAAPETLPDPASAGLQNYLEAGGKALFFVDRFQVGMGEGGIRPKEQANPLEKLFETYGLKVETDLVVDRSNAMATFTGGLINYHLPYPFWVQIRPEGFNQEQSFVSQLNSLVLPWTSSITIQEKLPEKIRTHFKTPSPLVGEGQGEGEKVENLHPPLHPLPSREGKIGYEINSKVATLFSSTAQAVKTSRIDPMRPLDPQTASEAFEQGKAGVYPLGVLVQSPAQFLVVGNTRFLNNTFLEQFQENVLFVENAIDTFSTGDQLIGIRSKGVTSRPIALLSEAEKQILKTFGILLSPILLSGLGLWIFWRRKRMARRLQTLWAY